MTPQDKEILNRSALIQEQAWKIIRQLRIEEAWQSVGAEPHLVGSLRMGLLMRHRDIDFHIYSSPLRIEDSFAAIAQIMRQPHTDKATCLNLLQEADECLQWQIEYTDEERRTWQIDMIHMPHGAHYEGYFERMAERIQTVLTDETRLAILRLKEETPAEEKIMGVEYYQAVLRDGVRTYEQLQEWRTRHPADSIMEWMP